MFCFDLPRLALGLLSGSSFSRYRFRATFEVQPFAPAAALQVAQLSLTRDVRGSRVRGRMAVRDLDGRNAAQ